MLGQFAAVHARHDDVRQEQVYVQILLRGGETSFDSVVRFKDLISDFGQLIADKITDIRIIFDEENGFRALAKAALRFHDTRRQGLWIGARKIEVEGGAMPDLTPDID